MSIIYEALRKSQKTRAVNKRVPRLRMPRLRVATLPTVDINRKNMILLFMIFLTLFFTSVMINAKSPPGANWLFAAKPSDNKVIALKQTVMPRLMLDGVFLSSRERLVMINHRAYHEGDNVFGMRITNIALDRVTLENKTRRMVLQSAITDID